MINNPIEYADSLAQKVIDAESDPSIIALVIANLAQYLADFTE